MSGLVTWSRLGNFRNDPLAELGYGAECPELDNMFGHIRFDRDDQLWHVEVWFVEFSEAQGRTEACPPFICQTTDNEDFARYLVEQAFVGVVSVMGGKMLI